MKVFKDGKLEDVPDIKFRDVHQEAPGGLGAERGMQGVGAKPFQHRDGDTLNELMLNNDAVPLVGGPLDGTTIHQPREVVQVILPVRNEAGKVTDQATYRRAGDATSEPRYEFVAPATKG